MKIVLLVILMVGGFVLWVKASGSYGALGVGPIAPTVAQCPKPITGYMRMCPVGASGNQVNFTGTVNMQGANVVIQ
jgi:hypothetical protein